MLQDIFSLFSKLSTWYRLLFVTSTIWIIISLVIIDPWTRQGSFGGLRTLRTLRSLEGGGTYSNWSGFFLMSILPVAILWGIIWIRQGFRKQQHIIDEEEVAIKQMFFDEGRLAFSNGKDITENPHVETDKDCAEAWAEGWREAYRLRQKLYEK